MFTEILHISALLCYTLSSAHQVWSYMLSPFKIFTGVKTVLFTLL